MHALLFRAGCGQKLDRKGSNNVWLGQDEKNVSAKLSEESYRNVFMKIVTKEMRVRRCLAIASAQF